MAYKSLDERYGDEILTNNVALNHFSQCKDCFFRHKVVINGKEYGYDKCFCRIYGLDTILRTSQLKISYEPMFPQDKPNGIYNNTEECEYYEAE